MESSSPIACQWNGCLAEAEKHAVFGRRVFDARADDISKAKAPVLMKHRDLCRDHIAELKKQYVDVVVMELDTCRDHSTPRRGRTAPSK
jgi:hypothetical protein